MKKMTNFINNKRNLIIIGGILLLIIIIILLVCFIFKKNETINQETLEEKLKKVGAEFYENKYYSDLSEENKQKLSFYSEDGIKVDITNLEVINPLSEEIKKALKSNECDNDKTKIIIYPKDPYSEKDYEIKIELSCKK